MAHGDSRLLGPQPDPSCPLQPHPAHGGRDGDDSLPWWGARVGMEVVILED